MSVFDVLVFYRLISSSVPMIRRHTKKLPVILFFTQSEEKLRQLPFLGDWFSKICTGNGKNDVYFVYAYCSIVQLLNGRYILFFANNYFIVNKMF